MAFMDLFSAPKQQQQQPKPQANGNQNNQNNQNANTGDQQFNQNQGNQNQGNQPNNNGNNNNQNGNNPNNQNGSPANPLDSFSKMWDNPTTEADAAPEYTLDPKLLSDVAGKQDFMQGIDPELMTKAKAGDVQSMFEVFQRMTQSAYARSLEHGGTLTGKFVGAREAHSSKGLGGRVRQELTEHALSNTPNYQHPVVKKQLKQTAELLQRQYPDAAPQEIADMAKKYITELSSALNPKDETKDKAKKGQPTNWDEFFDGDPNAQDD